MHTSHVLSGADFQISVDGRPASLAELLPGFDEHTRLGIVVAEDGAAAGASSLILAAVTGFYDRLRATEPDFFAYPDYFAFHVGRSRGSLRMLDVFPEHKEPVVQDDDEAIVRAVNDRGVTHLLVPDRDVIRSPQLGRDTRHSAQRRIRAAIAYSPRGRTARADIDITGPPEAEEFVTAMLGRARAPAPDGRTRETFRSLTVDDALGRLATTAQ
jgi:hypothetical protein